MSNAPSDRFARQTGLIPTAELRATHATVIGVGAIGRQLALQLASLGVGRIGMIDPDRVEATNVSTQGYAQQDIGQFKVDATAAAMRRIDPDLLLEPIADRFRPTQMLGPVVFCCVDSIATRAAIWRSLRERCSFWCDGRMRGEVLRILSACDTQAKQAKQAYAETLFPQQEAQPGPCTARGLIYPAAIAAGLMACQFAQWLRGMTPEADLSLNLLAAELATSD